MSLPVVGWCVALACKWDELLGSPDTLQRASSVMITVVMVVVPVIGWFGWQWLNHYRIRADDFFVLDRTAGTLTLLRSGVTLGRGEVAEVVEIHAWHRVRDNEGSSVTYLREVSVLARGPAGQLVRHSVVVAGHGKPVDRIAAELAGTFAVPRRKLVESFLGNSWQNVSAYWE